MLSNNVLVDRFDTRAGFDRFFDFALLPQSLHNGVRREKRALYLPVTHCSDTRTQRYPHDFALYACNGSSQKSGGGKPRGRVQVKNRSRNDDQPEAGRCKSLILLVEQRGIEPLTSALRTRRSAKLSYCPTRNKILHFKFATKAYCATDLQRISGEFVKTRCSLSVACFCSQIILSIKDAHLLID